MFSVRHQRLFGLVALTSYLLAVLLAGPMHQHVHGDHEQELVGHGHAGEHQHDAAGNHIACGGRTDPATTPPAGPRQPCGEPAFNATADHGDGHVCAICVLLAQSQILQAAFSDCVSAPLIARSVPAARGLFVAERITSVQSRGPPSIA